MAAMARRLALLLSAVLASAQEDESALVQATVKAHSKESSMEGLSVMGSMLSDGFSRQLAEAVEAVSRPDAFLPEAREEGPESTLFVKRSFNNPDGNRIDFNIAGKCTSKDQYGPNSCTLHWGEVVQVRSLIHLTHGLQKGDKVLLTISSRIQALNHSDDASKLFLGRGFGVNVVCSVCTGNCVFSMAEQAAHFEMDSTFPSSIVNSSYCQSIEKKPITDIPLADLAFTLPKAPPNMWQLAADFVLTTEIQRADGTVKVSQTVEPQISPGNVSPTKLREAASRAPMTLAEVLNVQMRKTPKVFHEVAKAVQGGKNEQLTNMVQGQSKKLSSFLAKFRFASLENGGSKNFSLTANKGCKTSVGVTTCAFPFGTVANASLGVHLSFISDPNSYAEVKMEPRVGGMLGIMAGAFLKPMSQRVPLCGVAKVKKGPTEEWMDAGPCGFHSLNIKAPAMALLLPDVGDLNFKQLGLPLPPFLPTTMGAMPPMSVEIDATLHHGDGRVIGNFLLELGLN